MNVLPYLFFENNAECLAKWPSSDPIVGQSIVKSSFSWIFIFIGYLLIYQITRNILNTLNRIYESNSWFLYDSDICKETFHWSSAPCRLGSNEMPSLYFMSTKISNQVTNGLLRNSVVPRMPTRTVEKHFNFCYTIGKYAKLARTRIWIFTCIV